MASRWMQGWSNRRENRPHRGQTPGSPRARNGKLHLGRRPGSRGPRRACALAMQIATRQTLRAQDGPERIPEVMRPARALPLLIALAAAVAHADSGKVVTGSLGGTTDFVFRGLSLTRGKPAAQASIDVEFPKEFYVGAFVATCDPNHGPSPPVEMDFWAGRYWRGSEGFFPDFRISEYTYPDDPRHVNYNRTEFTGTVGYKNQLFLAAIYSPNTKAVASSP